jgi:DNA-binding PadR family transcriptional regulator
MLHPRHVHGHRHVHDGFSRDDRRPHGGRHRHGHGRPRLFDHGELRLVILALIAERPRHGYELIKAIEDRLGGAYSPSPGVVYPTLTLLEELGHVAVAPTEGGRKLHSVTDAGREHLSVHAAALQAAFARMDNAASTQSNNPPTAIVRAMETVKLALRLRLAARPLTIEEADSVARALDEAATQISRL